MTTLPTSNGVIPNSIPHTKEKDLPDGGNWVVQKYGGTAIGKHSHNICDIVEFVFYFTAKMPSTLT
jgi:hypothetical protein